MGGSSRDSLGTNENVKQESDSRPTNGANGDYSYSKFSSLQSNCASIETKKMEEEIMEKFDMKKLLCSSNTIRIVDMGCAVGPNTFSIMQTLVDFIKNKHISQCPNSPIPDFQVFFNDQISNDFNALFRSLPQNACYFGAGVPGSFYSQLFPTSSLHLVHSSYSPHWLSSLSKEVKNKGRIHYTNAADEIFEAYSAQFAKDMSNFLRARAKELVHGGLMMIVTSTIPSNVSISQIPPGILYDCMSTTLMDMAKEGLVEEAEVDSFNLPVYLTTPEEMEQIVEKEGSFSIERMEASDPTSWIGFTLDIGDWIDNVRAAMEATFSAHFGAEIVDEMFRRLHIKSSYLEEKLHGKLHQKVVKDLHKLVLDNIEKRTEHFTRQDGKSGVKFTYGPEDWA